MATKTKAAAGGTAMKGKAKPEPTTKAARAGTATKAATKGAATRGKASKG
jgi:hypothetical protein